MEILKILSLLLLISIPNSSGLFTLKKKLQFAQRQFGNAGNLFGNFQLPRIPGSPFNNAFKRVDAEVEQPEIVQEVVLVQPEVDTRIEQLPRNPKFRQIHDPLSLPGSQFDIPNRLNRNGVQGEVVTEVHVPVASEEVLEETVKEEEVDDAMIEDMTEVTGQDESIIKEVDEIKENDSQSVTEEVHKVESAGEEVTEVDDAADVDDVAATDEDLDAVEDMAEEVDAMEEALDDIVGVETVDAAEEIIAEHAVEETEIPAVSDEAVHVSEMSEELAEDSGIEDETVTDAEEEVVDDMEIIDALVDEASLGPVAEDRVDVSVVSNQNQQQGQQQSQEGHGGNEQAQGQGQEQDSSILSGILNLFS